MRKIIAAINMTIDGFCDHTALSPGEDIHRHYQQLLEKGDVLLYGRITYQLMQYWQSILANPSEDESMIDFAKAIDRIPKIVFSSTLKTTNWHSASLSEKSLEETIAELKQEAGNDIFIGSRSLIIQLMNLNLLDELQLCIHPVLAGKGLPLFEQLNENKTLNLLKTKTFEGGAVIMYYETKQA